MNYDYLLCDLRVRFESPHELTVTPESSPFLLDPNDRTETFDLVVGFSSADKIRLPAQGGFWMVNACYISDDKGYRVYHCPVRGQEPYCCVEWDRNVPNWMNCTYRKGGEHHIAYTKNLVELLGLEFFLLQFRGLILHASLVSWSGKGILFSAPSGTGKSTQAALWEAHMGSRTLNGDRGAIRCQYGHWQAYGLPFAGTSGIYRNESVPVSAIVLLRQGPENRIDRVAPMEAFKRLLPECSARRWDSGFMDRLIVLLADLVQSIPVYQLECRPDLDAVRLLRDTIIKEE